MATGFAETGVTAPGTPGGTAASPPAITGVIYGGPAARAKRWETGFYALTKQGGGLIAIWWALTHTTGWVEWSGFLVFYVLNVLTMPVCYHRYFCHRSYETGTAMRYVLGIWGQMGAYGSIMNWSIDHRRHHAKSDKPGDVHSPFYDCYGNPISGLKGFRHSHIGWLFDDATTDHKIFGKGLVDDPVLIFCHKTRVAWFVISILFLPALWGWAFGGPEAITGTILIAGCLRMALALQVIALVNSLCHRIGHQRFKGPGLANNIFTLTLFTMGEGWHNNHHAHPRAANCGMAWWEVDPSACLIWVFEKLGLARNVNWVWPEKSPDGAGNTANTATTRHGITHTGA